MAIVTAAAHDPPPQASFSFVWSISLLHLGGLDPEMLIKNSRQCRILLVIITMVVMMKV